MYKIKPGTLTAGAFKSDSKLIIERFDASDNVFSFMSANKHQQAGKSFYIMHWLWLSSKEYPHIS